MNASILTTPQWSRARELNIQQFMPRELRPERNLVVGKRLQLARRAFKFGDNQGKFARGAGISPTAYNQWETGENYPGVAAAIKLCERYPGLTLDWIYRGKMEGLPTDLSNALASLLNEEQEADEARSRTAPPRQQMKVIPVSPRRRRTA
jgi:transcriptional regulator with XRE-family HTH domain